MNQLSRKLGLFFCTLMIGAPQSYAVLGEDKATVSISGRALPGIAKKSSRVAAKASAGEVSYEEVEIEGLSVREYADSTGKVYAVTWRGVTEPDLEVLLGKYFPEYKTENMRQAPSRARHKSVETSQIVVRRSGHMRSLRGLAYVPTLVPSAIDPGALE